MTRSRQKTPSRFKADDLGIKEPHTQVEITETLRIKFWRRVLVITESEWLRACGWIRVKEGWLLPEWHPKLRDWRAVSPGLKAFENRFVYPALGEPYDQNHALNSQRAHTTQQTVSSAHAQRHKIPTFPPYIMIWAWQPTVLLAGWMCLFCGIVSGTHPSRHLFFLAAVLVFCVSYCLSWRARRQWEMDWAEDQLKGRAASAERYGPN